LAAEEQLAFIKKCETYIAILKRENKLIAAQPLMREAVVIRKSGSGWIEKDITGDNKIQVGYYHILASGIDEAISIAKENPEFDYVPSACIEIRLIKTKETETGFVYPVTI
jgi:hypothetical protein